MLASATHARKFVSPYVYDKYVVSAADKVLMETLVLGGNTFRHYPCAPYLTDVTVQQSNMHTGQMEEPRAYHSAKHHLHGYKVERSSYAVAVKLVEDNHHWEFNMRMKLSRKGLLDHIVKPEFDAVSDR
ncbi:unnamed protein product [Phytophthora fragariaefolia]|uniref:Unnamed protein product n=1 Tax=Phytophthora fragariaefolia TaxID=1490495 RepID=A0A9W7D567_9STRA|nr:unnamed protein product [Phytophthora fragariaefolia]